MRLLGIDFETTGIDTANDRITEIGAVIWDTNTNTPLSSYQWFLYDSGIAEKFENPAVAEMCQRVSGITRDILIEFGGHPKTILEQLYSHSAAHNVEYLVAHNGENFDRPFLLAELTRHSADAHGLRTLPWLDTRNDLPFLTEPDSRKLKHLALDCGFINPFPHRALFDVMTMMKVLAHYPIEDVIAYSKIPFITIKARVEYADRQKAKDRRFSWEKIGEITHLKSWIKRIKEDQLEAEKAACSFPIVVLEG